MGTTVLLQVVLIVLLRNVRAIDDEMCDRRPLDTKTAPLPPDNRFVIEIVGVTNDKYVPNEEYPVRLHARDNTSSFIAYTIAAREDEKENEKNPRKPFRLDTGRITPTPNGVFKQHCQNTVVQADVTPKTSIEVTWTAPPKDNKCVTIYALVAVKPDVWYSYEGPLSQMVCEDRRNMEDMQPSLNDDCKVCEDARYQVTFEGTWSYNTHPTMFPETQALARFSDLVGASHRDDYSVWKFNSEAGEGLKMLAEQGNTTKLEMEIQANLGSAVRTVIKATGQPKPNMSTIASFRVSREHHRVSLVCGIIPSPDWFLGVANLELCSSNTKQWAPKILLNLYPMDAGTDSGRKFESPNEGTMPPQPISAINRDKEKMKPFARLHFALIRTYYQPSQACDVSITASPDDGIDNNEPEVSSGPTTTTSSSEEAALPQPAPPSADNCTLTEWESLECVVGDCVAGERLTGYRYRIRYHMVDGLVVGKYTENGPSNSDKAREIPEHCKSVELTKFETCEDTCEDKTTEEPKPLAPGEKWNGRRR